jgi:hypothetical protein
MDIQRNQNDRVELKQYFIFPVCGIVLDLALFLLCKKMGAGFWFSILLATIGFCSALIILLVKERNFTEKDTTKMSIQIPSVLACVIGINFSLTWLLSKALLFPIFPSKLVAAIFVYLYLLSIWSYYMRHREPPHIEMFFCFLAAGLVSSIMVFHYYAGNCSFYRFSDCVLLMVFLFFISTFIYLVLSLWLKHGNAIIPVCFICLVFWACYNVVTLYSPVIFIVLFFVIVFCLTYFLSLHPVDKVTIVVLSGVVCVLFIFNFTTAVIPATKLWMQRNEAYIAKNEFVVNARKESPDIYWFHMDGMMGFNTVELILGDEQKEFKNSLTERGFVFNTEAALNVGWTTFAIPSLASPNVYDSYIHEMLAPLSDYTSNERKKRMGLLNNAMYNQLNDLELFSAFKKAGYDGYMVLFDIGRGLETIPMNYRYGELEPRGSLPNILSMFAEHTVLRVFAESFSRKILEHVGLSRIEDRIGSESFSYVNEGSWFQYNSIKHYDKCLVSIFEEVLEMDSPKIIYLQDMMPHYPYIYDENGVYQFINENHYMGQYLPQVKYSIRVLIGMVDRILEENPYAIIVIQGDHGVHAFDRSELAKQGFTDEQMLDMNYSTISAVRIPQKYGTLSEPLDPLDITRYLVNHYVGEGNYDYLYYHEEE